MLDVLGLFPVDTGVPGMRSKVRIKKSTRQIVKAELNIDQTWSGLTPATC